MILKSSAEAVATDHDVCIVGAGPAGIALALACEKYGLSVLLLESGGAEPDQLAASFGTGHRVDLARHAAPGIAMARGLGGTSRWWGGRCVPFDDVDFAAREHVPGAAWPIDHQEIARWYPAAADFFQIGSATFRAPEAAWADLPGARCEDLERWCPLINMGSVYGERLAASQRIDVLLGTTVTGIRLSDDGDEVRGLSVTAAGVTRDISSRCVVLTCGGLESTRLLLTCREAYPDAFGGTDGALGHYYMGHLSGKIADIVLAEPSSSSVHDFFIKDGVYVRRRFTLSQQDQLREALLNIAFWVDNPAFHAVDHRNGMLSAVWMALAVPLIGRQLLPEGVRLAHLGSARRWLPHILNVISSPLATIGQIARIVPARYLSSPSAPGFIVKSGSGRYALHYHAEQSPHRNSSVSLSEFRDSAGVPFLDVNLLYREDDGRSVIRAHRLLDAALRCSNLARLEFYDATPEQQLERVMKQASDGFHQIGTTRMGTDPAESVVDTDCKLHGIANFYVASSSVFPSSGQASPTFLVVAIALRLAKHLSERPYPAVDHSSVSRSSARGVAEIGA